MRNKIGMKRLVVVMTVVVCLLWSVPFGFAQPGTVLHQQKISDTAGNFTGSLDNDDVFGAATAALGDLDGDGVIDLAVGAVRDDDGGTDTGALWILFLHADGTVKAQQKISDTAGNFTGSLDNDGRFGTALAALGDLDGDEITDLAVGNSWDNDGGSARGAIWILYLNTNGTVKNYQKISATQGGFTGSLDDGDRFGRSVANLGDLDGDNIIDLAVGAREDDDGGIDAGAVWILFLNANGTVKDQQKISNTQGGFTDTIDDGDRFGWALANLDDLDGDGVIDLAVGVQSDNELGIADGSVWILFLKADGTVKAHQKISALAGNFTGKLDTDDNFGFSVASLGDLDGDGVTDLAVNAPRDDDGGENRGAIWILFLNSDGTVKAHQKISNTSGNFLGQLDDGDNFGKGLSFLDDLSGDGIIEIAAGATRDDDGGLDRGAVWILSLAGFPACTSPLGDFDGNCRIDIDDFAYFTNRWLLDCQAEPNNLLCVPNNFCNNAIKVFADVVYNGSLENATATRTASCDSFATADLWHLYTPVSTGTATISLCGSDFDTTLALFDHCGGAELACNNDFCGKQSQTTLTVTGGQPYYIRVGGPENTSGNYSLLVSLVPTPVGDFCNEPIQLIEGKVHNGNTSDATGSDISSCASSDHADLWHAYTPSNSGTATISLCGSEFDTTLAVFNSCNGNELACNDDFCGTQSEIVLEVVGGQTYLVRVAGFNNQTGNYSLLATLAPDLPGDSCNDAIVVSENTVYSGNTTGATGSASSSCSSNDTADLWHAYTASGNGTATISLCGSSFDTTLSVWNACGGSELACNDDGCGVQSEIAMSIQQGQTYLVRVAGFEGAAGAYDLLITETHPANDNCSDPNVVTAGVPFIGSSIDAAGSETSSCGTNDTADVWLAYTPTVTAPVSINTCGSDFDTTLALFDACGGSELICNDDSCGLQSKVTYSVTAGNTYYLRVAGNNGATGNYTVNIIE